MSEGRKIDNMKDLLKYVDQRHPEAKTKEYNKQVWGAPRNRYEDRQLRQHEYFRKVQEDVERKKNEHRASAGSSKGTDRQVRDELDKLSQKYEHARQENELKGYRMNNLIDRYQSARAAEINQQQQK